MAGRNTVEIILSASDRASGALRGAFGSIENSSSKAMGVIKAGAAIAVGAMVALGGAVAKVGVDYDAMMEQSQIAWGTILGSQEEAKKTLKELQQMGAKTPYEFEGLDKSAKLLEMAGFKGKDLFNTLTKVGDAVSAVGGNDEVLQGVSMALYQMSAKGKISAQEMNQMAERGIPAWQMLADGMHKSVPELMKMSEQGKLFAKDAIPMMVDAMGNKFKGSMDAQSKTFNGMVSTMKDNLKMISGELSKPLFDVMKSGLQVVLPFMDKFLGGLKNGGISGGLAAIFPPSISNTIDRFKEGINGVFALFNGNKGAGISMLDNFGLGSDAINLVVNTVDKIKSALQILKGAFSIFNGDGIGGITFLTKMGFSTETIVQVVKVVNGVKNAISNFVSSIIGYYKGLFSGDGNLGQSFVKIFNVIKSIALPILKDAVAFIKDKIAMIKQFWDENGAQITQAVKNAWAVIAAVFKFIAPVILFIIKMLWDNVKGVIDGALKIIMGLIKVFAGIFTGDWSKMWEGIKQLLGGALEAAWNLINLLMFGKILGGIKTFVVKGGEFFAQLVPKMVNVVKNLDTYLFNFLRSMFSKLGNLFSGFINEGVRIFGTLRTFGANIFESLWAAIKVVVGKIASSVVNNFKGIVTGAKFIFEGLLNSVKNNFNLIKNAIVNPIGTAKSLVKNAIDAIKGFFSNMKVKIPLPHFDFSVGHKDIAGISVPYPKMDISWYDKGGVFYSPQVIGVGEKRPEFVGALDDLRKIVREETGSNGKGGNTYRITVNKEDTANQLVRELQRLEWLHG